LSCIEKFEGERENFIFNTFIYFEPVKRYKSIYLIRKYTGA